MGWFGRDGTRCPTCGKAYKDQPPYCANCGEHLGGVPPAKVRPQMDGNRWAKGPDDFAVRIDVDDVSGLFRRDLVVEAGTRALLLVEGRDERGDLGPGTYTLQRSGLTGTTRASAILVDAGDVPLAFDVDGLLTADPLRASITLQAVVSVHSAARLATALLRGATRFSVDDLRAYLYDEIEDGCREFVGRYTAAALNGTLALKEELAHHVAMHAEGSLERSGIRLLAIRALSIAVDDGRAVTAEAAAAEQKAAGLNRLRRAVLAARAEELTSETELERLLRENDRHRALDKAEHDRILTDVRSAAEDAELKRQLVVKRLEMLQTFELDKLRLEHDVALLELERQKREITLQMVLDEERLAAIARAELQNELKRADADGRLAVAKSDAEIAAIEREQDRLDLELAFWAKERMATLKVKREREFMLLRVEEKSNELRLEIERGRAEQEIEEKRLRALSEASADALLSVTGPEQAAIIANLRHTESLKGMSPEQILAMAAAKSPEIARAIQELIRGRATDERIDRANERVADAERRAKEETAAQHAEMLRMFSHFTDKALDTQRDTAVAAATSRSKEPDRAAGSGRCPDGHGERPAGELYCPVCGEALVRG